MFVPFYWLEKFREEHIYLILEEPVHRPVDLTTFIVLEMTKINFEDIKSLTLMLTSQQYRARSYCMYVQNGLAPYSDTGGKDYSLITFRSSRVLITIGSHIKFEKISKC